MPYPELSQDLPFQLSARCRQQIDEKLEVISARTTQEYSSSIHDSSMDHQRCGTMKPSPLTRVILRKLSILSNGWVLSEHSRYISRKCHPFTITFWY
jgi:hypothetical protein